MNKQAVLVDLKKFISIQSVSADSARSAEILKAVDFLKSKLESVGFDVELIQKENAPPLIIATRVIHHTTTPDSRFLQGAMNRTTTTIGIYGHYDVQPEDPVEEWRTKPFELSIKDGKLLGRGVADNKGHVIQNITAIEELARSSQLSDNIVFILEGEEEVGSAHFEEYVMEAKEKLKDVDMFFVTDVGMHSKNVPQIFYGLRGLVYFEIEVEIGTRDLHSGIYGNRVLNPIQVLADLFAKIKDVHSGKILIPEFYDDVRNIPAQESEALGKVEVSDQALKKETGAFTVTSVDGCPSYMVSKIYPSFDVHGIMGGYTGEGAKTVIPRKAKAKFSFRLVEYQKPEHIKKLVSEFIEKNLPEGVKFELKAEEGFSPFYSELNNEYVKKTAQILEKEFGHDVLFNRSGGSIPAAEILQRIFGKPIILTGFTLPDDNIHSPNENFDEEMFWKGIEVFKKIYNGLNKS